MDTRNQDVIVPAHCATWSTPVLGEVVNQVTRHHPGGIDNARPLDPFAGVGTKLYALFPRAVGVEIEPEWASADRRTIVADATRLPFRPGSFDLAISSPAYGNRMADHHNAQEQCRRCGGTGKNGWADENWPEQACSRCNGAGRNTYVRHTYRHYLGRELHERNTGGMQWGPDYRRVHGQAWVQLAKAMRPDGLFVLNVSDHYRKGKRVHVVAWHVAALRSVGFEVIEAQPVQTRRHRHGTNWDRRIGYEVVASLRLVNRPYFRDGVGDR